MLALSTNVVEIAELADAEVPIQIHLSRCWSSCWQGGTAGEVVAALCGAEGLGTLVTHILIVKLNVEAQPSQAGLSITLSQSE